MIKTLDASDYQRWDDYVRVTPEATFFSPGGMESRYRKIVWS